jgi:hypothetical protein
MLLTKLQMEKVFRETKQHKKIKYYRISVHIHKSDAQNMLYSFPRYQRTLLAKGSLDGIECYGVYNQYKNPFDER